VPSTLNPRCRFGRFLRFCPDPQDPPPFFCLLLFWRDWKDPSKPKEPMPHLLWLGRPASWPYSDRGLGWVWARWQYVLYGVLANGLSGGYLSLSLSPRRRCRQGLHKAQCRLTGCFFINLLVLMGSFLRSCHHRVRRARSCASSGSSSMMASRLAQGSGSPTHMSAPRIRSDHWLKPPKGLPPISGWPEMM